MRWAEVPWVKLSGDTWPWCFCSVSSPIASAARMPSSMSPASSAPERLRPHAGIAVGLELDPDLDLVALGLAEPRLRRLGAVERALEVLDVMADLMGDDIGLGEIARRAEAAATVR